MPDIKEKLVGVIGKAKELYANDYTDHTEDDYIAETLLDNGVTIQEWISVEERLPEEDKPVIICTKKNFIYAGMLIGDIWFLDNDCWTEQVTHWMPLPEPPKGE